MNVRALVALLPGLVALSCVSQVQSERPPESLGAITEARADEPKRLAIECALDAWHQSAAHADEHGYLDPLAPGAIYLGTDATERWTKDEFAAFVEPYFHQGRGWSYEPRERHVYVDAGGCTSWFDERLWNEKYGECRGTGVLVKVGDAWKIAHYNLTIPVPNELAGKVVELIRTR